MVLVSQTLSITLSRRIRLIFLNFLRIIYDILTVVLLVSCEIWYLGAFDSDIKHNKRTFVRLISLTYVVIWIRILKYLRILITKFGIIVTTFSYSLMDILIWFSMFCFLWLSFCKYFFYEILFKGY